MRAPPVWLVLAAVVVAAVLLAMVELAFLPLYVHGVPAPVTILVALVTTPWLVHRAAELSRGGIAAGAPLAAWLVAILVFGTAGPGGDILLPASARSVLLLAAGALPAVVVLSRAARRS